MRLTWRKVLEPFGKMLAAAERQMERAISRMSDEELRKLVRATMRATEMNCWWATYWAAPRVRGYARTALQCRAAERQAEKRARRA